MRCKIKKSILKTAIGRLFFSIALIAPMFIFTGCISFFAPSTTKDYRDYSSGRVERDDEIRDSEAIHRATMRPYQVFGKWYYPTMVSVGDRFDGIASWYGPKFHGKKTSNGEIYSMYKRTAAHKTFPMNTIVKVTNKANGRSTVARINDRGPFVDDRIIDLSNTSAREIDMIQSGLANVTVEVIGFHGTISTLAQKESPKSDIPMSAPMAEPKSVVNALEEKLEVEERELELLSPIKSEIEKSAKERMEDTKEVQKEIVDGVVDSTKDSAESIEDGLDRATQSRYLDDFLIQVGAFRSELGAQRFSKSIDIDRYSVVVKEFDRGDEKFFRVFVEGFKSEEEAEDFLKRNSDLKGAFIFRESD